MIKKKIKVAVAMSGGVDSSVAAAILKKQGYQVIGIFMHFWTDPHYAEKNTQANKCCSLEAQNDARRVADRLDIPLYTINLDKNFKKEIVDNFLELYKMGFTPNPCVRCNQFIKFGLFWQKAQALGCQYMATGHYVQLKIKRTKVHLLESVDKQKDQTYFLSQINPNILKHCLFPVGKYKKEKIRQMAEKFNLPVFNKRDSQEICFVPEKTPNEFLARYLKTTPGDIITTKGEKIGQHEGLFLYTIGQRKGLELNGGPWYVVDLNSKNNQIIVTNDPNNSTLFNDIMYVENTSWLQKVKLPTKLEVRIRYGHKGQIAKVNKIKNNLLKIQFIKKQRAITSGQVAVFYSKNECLGGGLILKQK